MGANTSACAPRYDQAGSCSTICQDAATLVDDSKNLHEWLFSGLDRQAIRMMFPIYYVTNPITPDQIKAAVWTWELIQSNNCPQFVCNKECLSHAEFPYESCNKWFTSVFYKRLFDVHPLCRPMFTESVLRSNFLAALFTFVFSIFRDSRSLRKNLEILAIHHAKKGVKAIEYGIMGEVLFWTLAQLLGDLFDKELHNAWVTVFSRMLEHIVPAAVFFELQAKKGAAKKGLLKSEEIKSRFGKLSSPDSAFSFTMSTSIKGIYEAKNIKLACPMDIANECYSYRADDIAQKIVVAALTDGELDQQTCSKKVKPKSRQNSGKQLAHDAIVPNDEEECETDTETSGPSGFLSRTYSSVARTALIEVEIT